MNLVLDASAAIGLSTGGVPQTVFGALEVAEHVRVPALYDFEITNVVWKYFHAKHWNAQQSEQVLQQSLDWPDERISGALLATEALALAREHRHPSYDMFYLAVARRFDSTLVTLDRRLARLARNLDISVIDNVRK